MSKRKIRNTVIMGIGLVILIIIGVIYSLLYNEGRWIYETDLSEYVFITKDIPMLIIGGLVALYVIYLVINIFQASIQKKQADKRYSRKISPLLGFAGFFGFAGFIGIWTYTESRIIFPFIFFVFFGFFGFFFEGKMSNTLEDELYLENKKRAELKAYKTGFLLLFITIWLVGMGMFSRYVEWCAIFMLIAISLIYALVLFLSSYLLYRYEKGE
ncbi:MAG: DUF3796 domain-containing protein [Anaerostipes sp.]|nr:DUF3796 domain-containing protein [Anaerostipes sp.]